MLVGVERAGSLPYASSLCGACYEVCPVKINIPEVLVHLRRRVVEQGGSGSAEAASMRALSRVFGSRRLYEAAQRVGRVAQRPLVRRGRIGRLPGALSGWTAARDMRPLPGRSFREWWRARRS
jgi:L-lactate dehydrogenase complex protein LldF